MKRFALVCTILMFSIFPAYSSAALIYDIYTTSNAGTDLLTGSIGFEGLAEDYVGTVTAANITLFEFDGTVLGNSAAPPPGDWLPDTLLGTIDVANSYLFVQDFRAIVQPYTGEIDMSNVGTAFMGGFGYSYGLYNMPGQAYLIARSTVPEPSALVLLVIGLAGLLTLRKRLLNKISAERKYK